MRALIIKELNMGFNTFVLGLFVFLLSATLLKWITVDPKLQGWVGMVFVAVLILEAIFVHTGRVRGLFVRRDAPAE